MMKSFNELIYRPPTTTRIKLDMIFPWMGKEWKIREIPLREEKNLAIMRQEC